MHAAINRCWSPELRLVGAEEIVMVTKVGAGAAVVVVIVSVVASTNKERRR